MDCEKSGYECELKCNIFNPSCIFCMVKKLIIGAFTGIIGFIVITILLFFTNKKIFIMWIITFIVIITVLYLIISNLINIIETWGFTI